MYRGANFEPLGDNNRLCEEIVGELLVERQIEANGALADIERPVLNVRVGLQDLFGTGTADAELEGPADRRSHLERVYA